MKIVVYIEVVVHVNEQHSYKDYTHHTNSRNGCSCVDGWHFTLEFAHFGKIFLTVRTEKLPRNNCGHPTSPPSTMLGKIALIVTSIQLLFKKAFCHHISPFNQGMGKKIDNAKNGQAENTIYPQQCFNGSASINTKTDLIVSIEATLPCYDRSRKHDIGRLIKKGEHSSQNFPPNCFTSMP